MTTFHDQPPQSRRAARQSERERASDDQPTTEGFTTFPPQQATDDEADRAQRNPGDDARTTTAPPTTSVPPPSSNPAPAFFVQPTPAPSPPSTDAAYLAAPPPAARNQDSTLPPPPPPSAAAPGAPGAASSNVAPATAAPSPFAPATASGAAPSSTAPFAPRVSENSVFETASAAAQPADRDGTAPERTLTRRELRELRARQEAESANSAPETPSAPATPSTAETPATSTAPDKPEPSQTVAPPVAPAPRPDAQADAVPHYPYSGADGQTTARPTVQQPPLQSQPRPPVQPQPQPQTVPPVQRPAQPPAQPLTVEPVISAYLEPPALIDPLSVVPETASKAVPADDALSVFESLLANPDGSANDATASDSPRSPLVDLPNASAAPVRQAETASPAPSNEQPTIAGLLGLVPGTPNTPPPPARVAGTTTNLSNARAEFDEQARKRLEGELPPVANQHTGAPRVDNAPATPSSAPANTAQNSAPGNGMPGNAPSTNAPAPQLLPTGHWSRQATADDESNVSVVSRTIGSGTSTTSALVLPAIPFAIDIRGPLNSSGEAMLTGSIDLPTTLSARGISDRFDHADIDSLLDLNDSDMVSTDSAPVRAVKAVSTFSNQSVTQTQKPKGTRALTVLMISAVSMAVVVAGFLVAAVVFKML